MTAAPRRSAATALACALRSSSSSAPSTSSTVTSSSSLLLRRFSTSSDKGEGSVHFDDGSGEKLAEVLDHALVRERERERIRIRRGRGKGRKEGAKLSSQPDKGGKHLFSTKTGQGEAQELRQHQPQRTSDPHDEARSPLSLSLHLEGHGPLYLEHGLQDLTALPDGRAVARRAAPLGAAGV